MRSRRESRPAVRPNGRAAGKTGETLAFVLELPSDLDMIEGAVAYLVDRCRGVDFDGTRLTLNFRVGMCEALANAVIYGNRQDPGKSVRVEVELSAERIVAAVRDEGTGFDPGEVPDPTLDENLERSGGRGIFLLHRLMDQVEYNERGNEVRFVLNRSNPSLRRASGE